MMRIDWKDTIKTWKQPAENMPSQRQMIRAATRSIKMLAERISVHVAAIDDLYGRHRMEPQNQLIMNAIILLQKELTKLYTARQALIKHRLTIAADVTKFGYSDVHLGAAAGESWQATTAAWKEHEHPRDPDGKFAGGGGGNSPDTGKKEPSHPYINDDDKKTIATAKQDIVKHFTYEKLMEYDASSFRSRDNKDPNEMHQFITTAINDTLFYKADSTLYQDLLAMPSSPKPGVSMRDYMQEMRDLLQAAHYAPSGTDPDKSYTEFSARWDHMVNTVPAVKTAVLRAEAVAEIINENHKHKFDNNQRFYRGTKLDELDNYTEEYPTLGSPDSNFDYVPMTVDKSLATNWVSGFSKTDVVIEYDAEALRQPTDENADYTGETDAFLVPYVVKPQPSGVSANVTSESNEILSTPMSIEYHHEAEIRVRDGTSLNTPEEIGKIYKITLGDLGEPFHNDGSRKTYKERVETLEEKYGHLGELEFHDDGASKDSKEIAGAAEAAGNKPCWKQTLKHKIMAAAAAAGIPWKEPEHPRDPDGQFAENAGAGGKKDDTSKPTGKKWADSHIDKTKFKKIMAEMEESYNEDWGENENDLYRGLNILHDAVAWPENAQRAWNELLTARHDFFSLRDVKEEDVERINTVVNTSFKMYYDNAKYLYRGTDTFELDKMLDYYNIGAGGGAFEHVPLSPFPQTSMMFAGKGGVVIQFHKKALEKHVIFQGYDYNKDGDSSHIDNPQGIDMLNEGEVRLPEDVVPHKGAVKQIIFQGHYEPEDQEILKETYSDLGPVTFARDEEFEWDEEVDITDVWGEDPY